MLSIIVTLRLYFLKIVSKQIFPGAPIECHPGGCPLFWLAFCKLILPRSITNICFCLTFLQLTTIHEKKMHCADMCSKKAKNCAQCTIVCAKVIILLLGGVTVGVVGDPVPGVCKKEKWWWWLSARHQQNIKKIEFSGEMSVHTDQPMYKTKLPTLCIAQRNTLAFHEHNNTHLCTCPRGCGARSSRPYAPAGSGRWRPESLATALRCCAAWS